MIIFIWAGGAGASAGEKKAILRTPGSERKSFVCGGFDG
jgi:hypothetical protein